MIVKVFENEEFAGRAAADAIIAQINAKRLREICANLLNKETIILARFVGNICPMNVFFFIFEVIGAASFQIIRIMSAGAIAEIHLVTKMEDKNEQIRQIVIRSYSTWSSGSNRLLLS